MWLVKIYDKVQENFVALNVRNATFFMNELFH